MRLKTLSNASLIFIAILLNVLPLTIFLQNGELVNRALVKNLIIVNVKRGGGLLHLSKGYQRDNLGCWNPPGGNII